MDEQLKQRLVGALVLVGAAVIFVPMVLHPPADEIRGGPAPEAEPGGASFSSRVIPLDEPRPVSAPQRPAPAEPVSAPVSPPAPVVAAPPEPPRPAVPAPAPSAPAPAPSIPAGSWLVQLGSFSNARNASALIERLRGKGYPAFARVADSAQGPVTRVYVGPSPSRPAAGEVVERLQGETRLRGIVVRSE